MKVRFNDYEEYLTELDMDLSEGRIDRRVIRLTMRYRQHDTLPIQHVSIVAGYLSCECLVELVEPCGQAMQGAPAGERDGWAIAKKKLSCYERDFAERGIEVRAGHYLLDGDGGDCR